MAAAPIAAGFLAALGGMLLRMLSTNIGYILAGLGIGIASYVGVTVLALELVDLLNDYLADVGGVIIMGENVGGRVVAIVSRAGLFTALDIIIAAYLTKISMVAAVIH